jgi:hypothetical protein
MPTTEGSASTSTTPRPLLAPGPLASAVILTRLAAAAAVIAAAPSLLRPGLLRGTPVTDGDLRGTALVVLVVGVPLVLAAMPAARRCSNRAAGAWLAGLLYLAYQGVMFCFGTPMNRLFPAYVALLGLSGWAAVALVRAVDARLVAERLSPLPRAVPWVLGTMALLNGLAWLARAVPIAWTGKQPASVADSGLQTSPVLVQDLSLWLPLALVVAVLAWRSQPWGIVLAPVFVLFYAVESISVASDQWWGVSADPHHPAVASLAAVPVGICLAVGLGMLWAVAVRERSPS